ncbi:leucine-rich repeat-containing protein kinase family protein [Psychromonas algicola]|uniref:leucine-rich repeat-containing protein kinase family protein n=1 Tax=Psychromonas algicola TaxID=2555642 RepID=UPI001067923C|nr:leucine-rich repeat-containing protein kinase family protein [Psychromonas sp. RZ5]TEW49258.1 protein kinase [Psychromonas sp. RZ5]
MHTIEQLKAGELKGIKRLQLSENLTTFPMEILSLADSLEILDLSNNQLSSLPDEIAQLTQLKIIFASNNQFTSLPSVLGLCPLLEMIGFKSNQITEVPAESLPLTLRWLILTDNKITALPEMLGKRPRLQKLALAGNQLTHLPNSFSQLTNLELLRISANQLVAFPIQLLTLPKLAWFAFSGNPFCQTNQACDAIDSVPEVASKDYVLQEVLGQGASGVIYKAKWIEDKQQHFPSEIAVKVFKGEVTSDGYPQDELQACLKVGIHNSLVSSIAQVNESDCLALIMELIPPHFKNLGLPPTLETCTRDTFNNEFTLSIEKIKKIVDQMTQVFEHMHNQQVCHGDLYAHNTLFDEEANIIFGDFGAASMYHMLSDEIQVSIKTIEQRALKLFIDDLLSICVEEDKNTSLYQSLVLQVK